MNGMTVLPKKRLSSAALFCWILAAVFAFAGYLLPSFAETIAGETTIGGTIAYLVTGTLLWLLTAYLAVAGRRAQKNLNVDVMRERSEQARLAIFTTVTSGGQPPPFFLYLRPFYSDELLVENPRVSSLPFLPSHYYAPAVSWETVFADRVGAFGLLVSLGDPSDV